MVLNKDFTIEPFKRKPEFRSDKGKKHAYPKKRKIWNRICLKKLEPNLSFNQTNAKALSMDKALRQFKHPPEVRKFMREAKAKQRAKKNSANMSKLGTSGN